MTLMRKALRAFCRLSRIEGEMQMLRKQTGFSSVKQLLGRRYSMVTCWTDTMRYAIPTKSRTKNHCSISSTSRRIPSGVHGALTRRMLIAKLSTWNPRLSVSGSSLNADERFGLSAPQEHALNSCV